MAALAEARAACLLTAEAAEPARALAAALQSVIDLRSALRAQRWGTFVLVLCCPAGDVTTAATLCCAVWSAFMFSFNMLSPALFYWLVEPDCCAGRVGGGSHSSTPLIEGQKSLVPSIELFALALRPIGLLQS